MSHFYLDASAAVKRYSLETGSAWVRALADPLAGHTIVVDARPLLHAGQPALGAAYEQGLNVIPNLPEQIAQGQFGALRIWLRANIYTHGKKLTPDKLGQRVTDTGMNAAPYRSFITSGR